MAGPGNIINCAVVLLVNLFRMPGGYDWALGLLDLLTFLGGLLLLCFHA